jgi:dUTP pyrophosphatase
MKLFIKTHNDTANEFYTHHGHFHDGDAGLDVYVLEDIEFKAGETKKIKLGISCEPEDGQAYYLFPRSSISKTPLRMANSIGLIDGGYRGEIMAVCDNIKDFTYTAEKGQRLFQLVATDSSPIHYELVDSLSDTSRGKGGFGSTGK